ncbi:hypothetical protein FE257_001505 [Aspergillus nanangensis]|uniref:Amidohydrolase-related domain-containing protein n=1 Tax=Aspergillus nanangensis TaxID=2582783 RepID=A0AAD4GPL4_ASPNN|nr:hypothetical protein FE257_001505 [Aspergillus nanangensis]
MPESYILLKGATVVSMEESEEKVQVACDILIENEWITAVGRNIPLPVEGHGVTIDARECIITPGFVDGHHHMWQHLLRGLTVDWSLYGYCCHLRSVYGSLYTPEDVYFANYAAALSLLSNGVTTVLDHSHVMNSPAHADAAVKGLKDASIRGTFCYGFYQNPKVPGDHDSIATDTYDHAARVNDARRVRQEHFACNDPATSLLTFGIALDEAPLQSPEQSVRGLNIARKLEARLSTVHASVISPGGPKAEVVQRFADAKVMGPDIVLSHGAFMTDSELDAVRSSGAGIVGTPDTELQMGMGYPVIWRASDLGCRVCLGLDITSNQGNDFMAQMRLALQTQRAHEFNHTVHRDVHRKTADVLQMATLGGAKVMQLESLIGSIVPGKKADLVIFRCNDIDTVPVVDAIGTVVFHASPKNIDTVIVDGRIVKKDGAYGTYPKVVRDELRRFQDLIEARPDHFIRHLYPGLLDTSRAEIAQYLNAPVNEIVYVKSATAAINTVLRNLSFGDKDVIIYFSTIFSACERTIESVMETTPLQARKIECLFPMSHDEIIARFLEAVRHAKEDGLHVRIALFDTIVSCPGVRLPFERLTNICREHNILSCVDGAHGVGQIPLNLGELDADFFVSMAHKWLYNPRGCAVFHVPVRNQHLIRTTIPTSHEFTPRGQTESLNLSTKSRFELRFQNVAITDDTPYLTIPAALRFRRDLPGGDEAIFTYIREVVFHGANSVAEILETEVLEERDASESKPSMIRDCAFGNVRLPFLIQASSGAVLDASGEKKLGAGPNWPKINPKQALDVASGIQTRLVTDHSTSLTIFLHNSALWARISGQVYLEADDFTWLGQVLKSLCERHTDFLHPRLEV